jgi:hypothetical protein
MPTIEIASVESSGLDLNQFDFEVAIIEENKLESHRGLFFDFLIKQNGTIVHIGNPAFKNDKDGGFYAGGIIDWDFGCIEFIEIPNHDKDETGANQQYKFQFLEEFKLDIYELMRKAIDKSPINKIFFLTDYQFGPEKEDYYECQSLEAFWNEHDNKGLCWNTLYEIMKKN